MAETRKIALEQTREKLLDAGEQLLSEMAEAGRLDPLRLLRPKDIADRAGVTSGMLYHIWPQEEPSEEKLAGYRRDLVERAWNRPADVEGLAGAAAEHEGAELAEMVRVLANFEFKRLAKGGSDALVGHISTLLQVSETMKGTLELPDPDPFLVDVEVAYSVLLAEYGLRMKAPLTVHDLALMLTSTVDGFANLSGVYPELNRADIEWSTSDAGGWSLFAVAVLAIIEHTTEPEPA